MLSCVCTSVYLHLHKRLFAFAQAFVCVYDLASLWLFYTLQWHISECLKSSLSFWKRFETPLLLWQTKPITNSTQDTTLQAGMELHGPKVHQVVTNVKLFLDKIYNSSKVKQQQQTILKATNSFRLYFFLKCTIALHFCADPVAKNPLLLLILEKSTFSPIDRSLRQFYTTNLH